MKESFIERLISRTMGEKSSSSPSKIIPAITPDLIPLDLHLSDILNHPVHWLADPTTSSSISLKSESEVNMIEGVTQDTQDTTSGKGIQENPKNVAGERKYNVPPYNSDKGTENKGSRYAAANKDMHSLSANDDDDNDEKYSVVNLNHKVDQNEKERLIPDDIIHNPEHIKKVDKIKVPLAADRRQHLVPHDYYQPAGKLPKLYSEINKTFKPLSFKLSEPVVTININRIEIKAIMHQTQSAKLQQQTSPTISLKDYLKQRSEGKIV